MSSALTTASLPLLPSFRRQQLLLEFASLKYTCPEGIYLATNSNDTNLWTGVFFVREGPYAPAVLRFEIHFPPLYPEAAPLVIFSTEIFHPLLVPLTTYTFTPGVVDPTATYSASETERLPPGAFRLRHQFPQWFHDTERGRPSSRAGSQEMAKKVPLDGQEVQKQDDSKDLDALPDPSGSEKSMTITLLEYVKTAFEDPEMLDQLPLDAAGNANAWHAWRSHRGLPKLDARSVSPSSTNAARAGASPRNPADWKWDGVWQTRVRNGIEESASDALLFGSKNVRGGPSSSDQIKFTRYDDEKLLSVQDDMLRMHGFAASTSQE